jgi:ABC-2 type transport system permease protein
MIAQLRSELLKQRTTRTNALLLLWMVGLVVLVVLLHVLSFGVDDLSRADNQLKIVGLGTSLGALFAGLLGAMSITAEIRHGTIRPTFLVSPRRARVVAAKVSVSIAVGAGFGLAAGAVAVSVGTAALRARGIDLQLDGADHMLLVVGSGAAAALWAAIGVGIGALVRHQVPTLVGICAWLLFVEGLLAGDLVGLGDVGRLLPGSAAAAISGQDPGTLLEPVSGLVLLAAYAAAAALVGAFTISRRDVE